ncbi:hypothetical protein [Collinsella intestinalis]|uniref:hypothetical protein n=1 Tax=Collinsella intestinalis TaxID=147207 RepID=UPI0025A3E814|nr:hypothetical protein [Collinsella intestinalis]
MLVRELGLASEAHDARLLARLPDRESPLRDVNRLHFLLKAFLDRHRGFDRGELPKVQHCAKEHCQVISGHPS